MKTKILAATIVVFAMLHIVGATLMLGKPDRPAAATAYTYPTD